MIQRLKNIIVLRVHEQEFTLCSNFKVYINQYQTKLEYVPTIEDDTTVSVLIPYEDAMKLQKGYCRIQMAWTDKNNNPRATKIKKVVIEELMPIDGYR